MSGIGRGIAALLLAGAVAGAAAFAHQLGREAAPAPLRSAGMAASQTPPPLVVVAAPAPPLVLPRHAARPSHSPVPRPAIQPVAAPPAPASAPAPPSASATAAPPPAAPVPPPQPAAPVAVPAPSAPADRALAMAASVPAQGNEHGHGKAKGHDKDRKDPNNSAGDTPVGLAATPPETPAPSGTETAEAVVPDSHGPDDRGNKHDGGGAGNGTHGGDGGD